MNAYKEAPAAVAALLDELTAINARLDAPEVRELIELVDEERSVCDLRSRIRKRIDRLYMAEPLSEREMELLHDYESAEQLISREGRLLQRRIDEVRAGLGLPSRGHRADSGPRS